MINGIGSNVYGSYQSYGRSGAAIGGNGVGSSNTVIGRSSAVGKPATVGDVNTTAGRPATVGGVNTATGRPAAPAGRTALPVNSGSNTGTVKTPSGHAISPYAVTNEQEAREAGLSEGQIRGLKKAGQIECATCASRMYQDGSDENVSFKSAAHVSPEAAGAAVRSHEGEHVSNAFKKAAMNNGKVISAAVSIHMATCPECGRSYVSGGTTSTSIMYYGNSGNSASAAAFTEAAGGKGSVIDAVL